MKILFGFKDVLSLDPWLDYFESLGYEVDGAMSGEDVLGTALKFKPNALVLEYQLSGEVDSLAVFYSLIAKPEFCKLNLILIVNISESETKKLNNKFVQSSGILAVIPSGKLNFEVVEESLKILKERLE